MTCSVRILVCLSLFGSACGASAEPSSAPSPVAAPSAVERANPPASAAPTAVATAVDRFPLVEGTRFTFRGQKLDGSEHTWTTKLVAIDASKDLFQYQPHENIANWFSKAGLRADASGIHIVGETLDDTAAPPTLAVAFPITAGAVKEVPGLFPCKYTVVARETVKVPAGSFDAWKIALKDNANPAGAAWIAPGSGLVKIQLPTGRVDELVSIEPPR